MFNWFKSKVELKSNNSVMSSFYIKKGLKLGAEIVVPDNFECLVFHNSKHYTTLSSGKYKLEEKEFSTLIEKQHKNKKKLKYIKGVYHFVSTSFQKLEIKHKKQKYIIEFNITNSLNFVNFMLLYTFKVDNDYVLNTLNELFKEILAYHKHDYKKITKDSLINLGININNFYPSNKKVSILNSNQIENSEKLKVKEEEPSSKMIEENKPNEEANETNAIKNNENSTNNNSSINTCPRCGNIAKFNTTYCLKCGYKLEN